MIAISFRQVFNFNHSWYTPCSARRYLEACAMYNVDVCINDQDARDFLRVIQNYEKTVTKEDGETEDIPEFELKGLWDGYDEHTGLPGRNSYSLIEYKGAKMTLYKLPYSYELKKISAHTPVKDITVSEDMKVTKEPLPKGQYMYRFVVRDVFGNRIVSGNLMPVNWDGKNVSFPIENKQ